MEQQANQVAVHVTRRLFAIEGETRLNLLRLVALAGFYGIHLVNRFVVGMSSGDTVTVPLGSSELVLPIYDTAATGIVVTWASMTAAILLVIRSTLFRGLVPVVVTLMDVLLLTTLLMLGNGPSSPMLVAYFLVIVGASLRGRREHVWAATLASAAGYGATVGFATQFRPQFLPNTYHYLIMGFALLATGLVMDSLIGSMWSAVRSHGSTLLRIREVGGAGEVLVVPEKGTECPWCGDKTSESWVRCGRCQQPLVAEQPFQTGRMPSMMQTGPVHWGWAISVMTLIVLFAAIAIDIGVVFPALLVPYLGMTLFVLVGLGRLLQLDLRVNDEDRAIKRSMSTLGTAAAALAFSAALLVGLIVAAILLGVVAFLVVFGLCIAVIAGAN